MTFLLQTLIPHPSISFAFYLHGWNVVYSCTLIRTCVLSSLFLVVSGVTLYYVRHTTKLISKLLNDIEPTLQRHSFFLHENNMPINILV